MYQNGCSLTILYILMLCYKDITCIAYKNVTQSSYPDGIPVSEQEYAARAIDGDQFVFTQTKHENQSYWTITFQRPTIISCFSMFIYGGLYNVSVNLSHPYLREELCEQLQAVSPITRYRIGVCCKHQMVADSLTVLRTDPGALKINEIYLDGCCRGFYGLSCMECNKSCSTCDAANGKCLSCAKSLYGEKCDKRCPYNCSDDQCDRNTGNCRGCHYGFDGPNCQPCENGKYGSNCSEFCSNHCLEHCDAHTGACHESRYEAFRQKLLNEKTAIIFGAVILFLLLGAIVILVKRTHCLQEVLTCSKCEGQDVYQIIELQESVGDSTNEYDDLYENTVPYVNIIKEGVPVADFGEMVKKKTLSVLKSEFKDISCAVTDTFQNALQDENRRKNRYKRIYPYDYNRVKLDMVHMPEYTDYVNASYIHGFIRENKYIAAQGPFNHETTLLFWEMVWQSDCSKIVMLTNTREQHRTLCVEYWPENEDRIGRIKIKLEKYRRLPLIIIRTFVLQKGNELRKIKHYQFTGWLQKSGPSNVNAFLQLYNLTQGREEDTRPIIVHCSAGIGRTGTYIAFDCLMDEANETGQLSVVNCILKLRQQRPLMVQTSDEYHFLHKALAENLTHVYAEVVA
nr:receptor-type tyrosine-protein phosphatase C-like isoform X2 [Crassostrea gigas]